MSQQLNAATQAFAQLQTDIQGLQNQLQGMQQQLSNMIQIDQQGQTDISNEVQAVRNAQSQAQVIQGILSNGGTVDPSMIQQLVNAVMAL